MTDGAENVTGPEGTGAVSRRPPWLRANRDGPATQAAGGSTATPAALEAVAAPAVPADAAVRAEAAASPAESDETTASPLDPVFERLATAQERAAVLARERPEVVIGAAFGGGLILATILKRFGRR